MSIQLGNLPITATMKTKFPAPSEGVKAIVIGNESPLTVTITMESGGVQKTLYPAMVDWFAVGNAFTGNILINPIAILNNGSQWPSSSLVFDAIGLYDTETASMYPVSLSRGMNVGNNLSLGTAATSIANDGNAAGTSILEATVAADIASAVSLTNDGVMSLGTAAHNGSLTLHGPLKSAGAQTVPGNLTVQGSLLNLLAGALKLSAGSVSALSIFTGSGQVLNAAHGLGKRPDFIIPVYAGNFGSPAREPDLLLWSKYHHRERGGSSGLLMGSPGIRIIGGFSTMQDDLIVAELLQANQFASPHTPTQTLVTGGTITTNQHHARVTAASAVTGIIMASGTYDGQELTVLHTGAAASSITFATAGSNAASSHVATDYVISGLSCSKYVWEATTALWYPVTF